MNDDYLWDRSGEPDTEVAKLEELFQELRFDKTTATPPPFKLSVVPIRNRFSFPVKIAAGLVFLLLAGAFALKLGGWSLRRNSSMTKAVPSVDERAPVLPVQGPQASITHDPGLESPAQRLIKCNKSWPLTKMWDRRLKDQVDKILISEFP